jgi:CheY-like chemotaxis protein
MIAPVFNRSTALVPLAARRPQLLIVSDSAARLAGLQAALGAVGVEMTCAGSLAELDRACSPGHALAAVDVRPARLTRVLRALRTLPGCGEIPILVLASERLNAPYLAGVLPQYRAMACGPSELIALARRRCAVVAAPRQTRRLL